jgi:arabinose-5-phosphate isomerase
MYRTLQVHEPSPLGQGAERLDYARQIIQGEAKALEMVASRLDDSFLDAIELLANCNGRVALTGTGKSADVAQKIAGTFNSTGTRSYCLDATRAVHGDLGMVHPDDVVLMLSFSGESEEIVRVLPRLKELASSVVALTGSPQSTLARAADVTLALGPLSEVCPLELAPSTSTTAMIAVGDALAFVLSRLRNFTRDDFARFHPAGSLGRKLMKVEAVMRRGNALRLASCEETVRQVFARGRPGRRTGAVILTDASGRLCGLFTDSDLARLFERRREADLDGPIGGVMTPDPYRIRVGATLGDAVDLLKAHKISELPVVDRGGRLVGLIDVTDLIGLLPADFEE